LSAGLDQQSFVTKIYRRTIGPRAPVDSYKLAVGHILLENGILVGELHDMDALYVDDGR
jgi:hypothetical protein